MSASKEKFYTLDALRGVGAVCVVLAHIATDEKVPFIFANASPGVDFFFVLSGFVIAHAYEQALRTTMTFKQYFRIRMIRLYPTVLIGGLAGFLSVDLIGHGEHYNIWLALALQVLLIPMLAGPVDAYPLNAAHWSLFFELFGNFVHGAIAKHVTELRLKVVIALSALALVVCAFHYGTLNIGTRGINFIGGFARIGFAFSLGLLFYRLHTSGRLRAPRLPAVVVLAALAVAMAVPAPPTPMGEAIHDIIAVLFVFPAFVLFGASAVTPPRFARFFEWLGIMSYPLYALHLPLLKVMGAPILTPGVPHVIKAVGWSAIVVACVVIAWLVADYVDAPLRAWLSKVTRKPKPPSANVTSASPQP